METLRIRKKSQANEYIKATRLKLKEGKDLAQLVGYLAEQAEGKSNQLKRPSSSCMTGVLITI